MIDWKSPETLALLAANDNDDHGFIRLPSASVLLAQSVVNRMAISYRELLPCSRYVMVTLLAETVWGYKGVVIGSNGEPLNHLNICPDTIMRTDEDPSCSWLGSFLRFAISMPKQAPQKKTLPRLELLYLALAIRFPTVAARVIA